MTDALATCPRCLQSLPREEQVAFCPRCGLDLTLAHDDQPVRLDTKRGRIEVKSLLAFGAICNLYRCAFEGRPQGGVFKIARLPQVNQHVEHEFESLNQLLASDNAARLGPFLPRPDDAIVSYAHNDEPPRKGVVLSYHTGIDSADDLYSLEEVRAAYPAGIDPRDMAWIWRRLLTALGYVHACRYVHGQVTPDHVLIDPRDHKLVLIGWCGAAPFGCTRRLGIGKWNEWGQGHWEHNALPAVDLAYGARSMSYLLGAGVEAAIARHLERAADSPPDAFKLLDDFDRLIEALWGPRRFREFKMPARIRPEGSSNG